MKPPTWIGSPFVIAAAIVFWWLMGGELKDEADALPEVESDKE